VFAVVLGGMYSLLGPAVGAALTIALSEWLRIAFGLKMIGMAETIYGFLLVVFIIFLPAGIVGSAGGFFVGGPDMAPHTPQTLVAPRRSRGAPR